MKKLLYVSLFTGLLLITPSSRAIVFQVNRWWHPELQQEVNTLMDIHADANDYYATYNQRSDIIDREATAFRIVEDKSEYYKSVQDPILRNLMKRRLTQAPRFPDGKIKTAPIDDSRLRLLKQYFTPYQPMVVATPISGIHLFNNTHNVEFRYYRDAHPDDYDDENEYLNDKAEKKKRIEEAMQLVATYNDNPILNAYYQLLLKYKHVPDIPPKLINARILHALHTNSDKKAIDIIAGKNHLSEVESIMPLLGYEKIISVGAELSVDSDRSRVIVPLVDIKKTLAKPLADIVKKPIKSKL